MTESAATTRLSPREVTERVIQAMLDIDMTGFGDMFAEDGVLLQPYAPKLELRRLEGRAVIRDFLIRGQAATPLKLEAIHNLTIYETDDPEVVLAEFDGDGSVSTTGGTYTTTYMEVLRVRDGEIVWYRHYAEPVAWLIDRSSNDSGS